MITSNRNIRFQKEVRDGLDFVMQMFDAPQFPRTILTGTARRPYIVNSRDEAMMHFEAALYEDCYMNAFLHYDAMTRSGGLTPTSIPKIPVPNHLMIDLDRAPFNSDAELEQALADTLQNIKASITGISSEYPIVIASGSGGYHLHVPLPGLQTPLQEMPEFETFRDHQDLNNKFLQFAERRLTNNKADHRHNPSMNSCLFRIPGTINTKARAADVKDPMVRIVKGYKWVFHRITEQKSLPSVSTEALASRPTTKFLNDFYAYLVQQQINDNSSKSDRRLRSLVYVSKDAHIGNNNSSIWWIDKLLQTAVEDGRKDLLFWVLAPYLITIRKMDPAKACSIMERWLERCDDIRRLEPGWSYFRNRIRCCIEAAQSKQRKPDRLEKLQEYHPELYDAFIRLSERK